MREYRRVILDSLPNPEVLTYSLVRSEIYRLLHNFNVLGMANIRGYQPKNSKTLNYLEIVDFATREDADMV
jgi:hypothetical protein